MNLAYRKISMSFRPYRKKVNLTCLCAMSVIIAPVGLAIEPNIVPLGNFNLIPTLSVDVLNDDNIYRSGEDEQSSLIGVVSPRLDAALLDGPNFYNINAQIINGSYAATSGDDYTDWSLGADAHMELTSRHILDLHVRHFDTHEPRGTGLSQYQQLPDTPNEYNLQEAGVTYQFGTNISRGRLVFDLNNFDIDYTNNSAATDPFGYDRFSLGATFFINVLPRTDLLFEIQQSGVDYDATLNSNNPLLNANRDSEERYGYVGLSWEATAQTTGTIKIGAGKKDFDSSLREDISEPSYEAGINWAPLTYSIVDLTASQTFDESFGFGDARRQTQIELSWQHEWSNRFTSILRTVHQNYEYIGVDLTDTFDLYSVGVNYAFARWLDVRLELNHDTRDSSIGLFGFEQNMIVFGIVASL